MIFVHERNIVSVTGRKWSCTKGLKSQIQEWVCQWTSRKYSRCINIMGTVLYVVRLWDSNVVRRGRLRCCTWDGFPSNMRDYQDVSGSGGGHTLPIPLVLHVRKMHRSGRTLFTINVDVWKKENKTNSSTCTMTTITFGFFLSPFLWLSDIGFVLFVLTVVRFLHPLAWRHICQVVLSMLVCFRCCRTWK